MILCTFQFQLVSFNIFFFLYFSSVVILLCRLSFNLCLCVPFSLYLFEYFLCASSHELLVYIDIRVLLLLLLFSCELLLNIYIDSQSIEHSRNRTNSFNPLYRSDEIHSNRIFCWVKRNKSSNSSH